MGCRLFLNYISYDIILQIGIKQSPGSRPLFLRSVEARPARQRNPIFFMRLDLNWNPVFCKIINSFDVYFHCQPSFHFNFAKCCQSWTPLSANNKATNDPYARNLYNTFYGANQCSSVQSQKNIQSFLRTKFWTKDLPSTYLKKIKK